MATRSVPQPPFSVDVLADLHAGNLDPEVRDQLWPAVQRDPDALRVLRSLDEVRVRLHDLGSQERVLHRMPADIAARLEQFVTDLDGVEVTTPVAPAAAAGHPATPLGNGHAADAAVRPAAVLSGTDDRRLPLAGVPAPPPDTAPGSVSPRVVSAAAAPPPRPGTAVVRLRRRSRSLLAAAAAAMVVLAGAAGLAAVLRPAQPGTPVAQPPALDVGDQLTSTAALSVLGRNDVTGPLGSEAALRNCVAANGLNRPVLGSTDIVFRGRESVLILLAGPQAPAVTALVVGTGCTTGDPQQLTVTDIG